MDMNEVVNGVVLTKSCKVSEDEDTPASEQKTVTLRVKFNGITLGAVFAKAMSSTVITAQTKLRKRFASLKPNEVIDVEFSAPGSTAVDPIGAAQSLYASLDEAGQAAFIADLKAKAAANKTVTQVELNPAVPKATTPAKK